MSGTGNPDTLASLAGQNPEPHGDSALVMMSKGVSYLPIAGFQFGTHDVRMYTWRLFLASWEMGSIPDHHILILDGIHH